VAETFASHRHKQDHPMPINVQDFADADNAFREQIKAEMQRATATLHHIAALLQAGFADPQMLKEFRESVDRVREAGWIAQQGLDSAQSQEATEMLFAHRARAAISLLKQLRLELELMNQAPAAAPLKELLEAGSAFMETARSVIDRRDEES
jgi:hypothetical protein